jgi:hypothetical protein
LSKPSKPSIPGRINLLPKYLTLFFALFLQISYVNGDDFVHFLGEDIHRLFSAEPLAAAGLGGAFTAGALLLENGDGNSGFMGEGCLRNISNVCDKAFGLTLLGAGAATWATGSLLNSDEMEDAGQMLTEGLFLTYAATGAMKLASDRMRPDASNSRSFPSAHSSGTACSAVLLWDRFGAGAGIPAVAIAAFTALSRVTLGKHYPSDVIAGAAIGTAIGFAVIGAHEDDSSSQQIQPSFGISWSSSVGFGVYF